MYEYKIKSNLEELSKDFNEAIRQLITKEGILYIEFNDALNLSRKTLRRRFSVAKAVAQRLSKNNRTLTSGPKISPAVWTKKFLDAVSTGPPAGMSKGGKRFTANIAYYKNLFNPLFLVERRFDHPAYNKVWWSAPEGNIAGRYGPTKTGTYFVWTFWEYGIRSHPAYAPLKPIDKTYGAFNVRGKFIRGVLISRKTGKRFIPQLRHWDPAVRGANVFETFWTREITDKGLFLIHVKKALTKIFKGSTKKVK